MLVRGRLRMLRFGPARKKFGYPWIKGNNSKLAETFKLQKSF